MLKVRMRVWNCALASLAMFAVGWGANANAAVGDVITFATAPTQSVARTKELYGPIAEYLSEKTGKEVKLVIPRNFLEYTSKMRKGEYDIIFDGPHFVSWRMQSIKHIPVARLPGALVFVAVVKEDAKINTIDDLIAKKVCAVNSPNLATLSIIDAFTNPVRQPVIVSQRSFKDAMKCLKLDKGAAAFLPVKFWNKFKKKGKTTGLKILYSTKERPLPPRTFSMTKTIDIVTRDKIVAALINSEGQAGTKPVLDRFKSKRFVAAEANEYKGLARLLASVWGFHQGQ